MHLLEIIGALLVTAELGWSLGKNFRFSLRQTELRSLHLGLDVGFAVFYLLALFVLWRALL